MYKLILADDETDVREGLLDQINWAALGFDSVETAENGREAAEMIEKSRPDVVVTDIQMPFMNGLQLAEWIRQYSPSTRIIILTGFEEFEYAQKAIKLQIDEYVLKPFSSKDLEQVLTKVKQSIDREMEQRENLQALREHYRQNLPMLQNLFLAGIVTRKISTSELEQKCRSYQLDLEGEQFAVAVISLDRMLTRLQGAYQPSPSDFSDSSGETGSLRDTPNVELKQFAVLNIAQETMEKHRRGYAFIHAGEVVLLMLGRERRSSGFMEENLRLLEEIRHHVERYLKLTVTIGAGLPGSELAKMPESYGEARQALDYRMILGTNKVIWIGDVEQRSDRPLVFDESLEQQLVRKIKLGSDGELLEMMDELFSELIGSGQSYGDFQLFLLELLTTLVKTAKEHNADLEAVFGDSGTGLAAIASFTLAEDAKEWFTGICLRLRSFIAADRQSGYRRLVEEAKSYVKAHYAEEDMSIGRLCQHLHISTGYFSNIFKKETKMTFVGYLMGIRMEAAQELLLMTDLKAFEIAEKVGFSDPNYFSFCFKKRFGVSPKEYRNGVRA
ncbi:two-component system response regulator [Paenibacillus yonginensis]|uniref:Two-component system response regulator n=1 Tax=Paenibacillus yonginensis TaxID=1462996 RepID=A0A1B1N053_9BACL|nr:response regulator [Paenibacillus yonginensis]ANS74786.1 two-component system response regulator [Paenibacillus yonginensis]